MIRRALASVGVLVLAASPAVAQSPPPFSFEDVDFTPGCAPNDAFGRLLTILAPASSPEAGAGDPKTDEPLYNAVSGAVLHELQLNREAPWHGLRLVGVRFFHGVESGPIIYSLVFADSPERVREVWNARGWNLPSPGETRVVEDEEIVTTVGIGADGERTTVTCSVD